MLAWNRVLPICFHRQQRSQDAKDELLFFFDSLKKDALSLDAGAGEANKLLPKKYPKNILFRE
ncbi:MAG: hypothetical protein H7Y03_02910 [Chitinophagaceae bacterium]|nr:hypothetical protein [Chitinophagaceae bacterium]